MKTFQTGAEIFCFWCGKCLSLVCKFLSLVWKYFVPIVGQEQKRKMSTPETKYFHSSLKFFRPRQAGLRVWWILRNFFSTNPCWSQVKRLVCCGCSSFFCFYWYEKLNISTPETKNFHTRDKIISSTETEYFIGDKEYLS